MAGPPAPDDRLLGNGHREPSSAAGYTGGNPVEAQPARLFGFWALVLQRFHDYVHRDSDPAVSAPERHEEGNDNLRITLDDQFGEGDRMVSRWLPPAR